jgi:ubiquinone/menaquinone biosynthesis C-methylase UbiE
MTQAVSAKPFKGIGMEGLTAKWYATQTGKSMDDFKALARRVSAQIPSDSRVLEVAPGPGYFSIELAKLGNYQITGLDISRTFVDIAAQNANNAHVHVEFRHGNASAMPFEDNSFDFLLCRAAFKNFTEPVRALQEMHRVLRKGGQALIIDLRRDASLESISQAVDQMHLGKVNALVTRLTFRFMLLNRAYTEKEFRQMLTQTQFARVNLTANLIGLELSLQK